MGYNFIGRKNSGASRGYKSTTELLKGAGKKPRKAKIKTVKKKNTSKYKVPKTPKVSGRGWGG